MTKVEKETLVALAQLGRRKWWTIDNITCRRLMNRLGAQRSIGTSKQAGALYDRATGWKIYGFMRQGLVETKYGPLFRITKAGQKVAKDYDKS